MPAIASVAFAVFFGAIILIFGTSFLVILKRRIRLRADPMIVAGAIENIGEPVASSGTSPAADRPLGNGHPGQVEPSHFRSEVVGPPARNYPLRSAQEPEEEIYPTVFSVDLQPGPPTDELPTAASTKWLFQTAPAGQAGEIARTQVRQLIKAALECPTAQGLADFLTFAVQFRRLAVWNARMAYIQRPGARVIATEYEWGTVDRFVLADAVPIIILWPFSPIRFVYEFADTGPRIDREDFNDPFAVVGELKERWLSKLEANLMRQKTFKIAIERRRQGFDLAGSTAAQVRLPFLPTPTVAPLDEQSTGAAAHSNARTSGSKRGDAPQFRIVLNDSLQPKEQFVTLAHEIGHIFCGHLGGCIAHGREEDESGWPDRRHLRHHEREIEAEAVAYIVSCRAGLITRSAEYLKRHAEQADLKAVNEDLIVRAAARIERLAGVHYGTMLFKQ